MKSRMRMAAARPRSVFLLAALLAVVAVLGLLTDREVKAQSGPPDFLIAPELKATAKEGNVIELIWTSVPGAVRYELWTWPGSNWEQLDGGALTETTHSHTGLIDGTTYYYAVRAVPASGMPGVWSEIVGATASEIVAPTATPTSTETPTPTATSTVTPTATATRVPPGQGHAPAPPGSTDSGPGPSTYPDESSTEPGSVMAPPGSTDLGSGGAPPGSTQPGNGPVPPGYTNPGGPAPPGQSNPGNGPAPPGYTAVPTATATYTPTATPTPSSTATATFTATFTPTLTPTSEPTATPTATASVLLAPGMRAEATAKGVELNWEAAAGAVRYELMTWWDSGRGWQRVGGDNLTVTAYTHTEVMAGTTYYYTIRAVNGAGETSDWLMEYPAATALVATGAVTSTPTPTPTPTVKASARSVPSVPELTAEATVRGVALSWEAVPGAVRYELAAWWEEKTGWQRFGGDDLAGTSYTHADIAQGTTYYYTIRAVNAERKASGWLLDYPSATAK